jgi:acyl carrier protein
MRQSVEIRRFIRGTLLDPDSPAGDPLAAGMLDSLALEQLIGFLEERYGIALTDEEIDAERFSSIPAVVAMVRAHLRESRDLPRSAR